MRYSKKPNKTRSYAKVTTERYATRKTSITRDETSKVIHDRKKYTIPEKTNETIRDKRIIQYATNLRKWAPGATNRAALIFLTDLPINPAAPCSEGRDSCNSGKGRGREGTGNDQSRINKVTMIEIYLTTKKKKEKRKKQIRNKIVKHDVEQKNI